MEKINNDSGNKGGIIDTLKRAVGIGAIAAAGAVSPAQAQMDNNRTTTDYSSNTPLAVNPSSYSSANGYDHPDPVIDYTKYVNTDYVPSYENGGNVSPANIDELQYLEKLVPSLNQKFYVALGKNGLESIVIGSKKEANGEVSVNIFFMKITKDEISSDQEIKEKKSDGLLIAASGFGFVVDKETVSNRYKMEELLNEKISKELSLKN